MPWRELSVSEDTHAYFDIPQDRSAQDVFTAQAAWRSMWLRTSTEPQDKVFSIMHVLGASIDVNYVRSPEDLLFELVDKSAVPGWLTVAYDAPVYQKSGLVPILPTFSANSVPQYEIAGKINETSEFMCGEFCCELFDAIVKSTTETDNGHLVCARLFEVKSSIPLQESEEHLPFHNAELQLSSPWHEFNAGCKLRGSIGPVAMILGPAKDLLTKPSDGSGTPVVHFLDKSELGTWRKSGTGFLEEPVFRNKYFLADAVRRHLRVGGSAQDAAVTECDCPSSLWERSLLHKLKREQVDAADEGEGPNKSMFAAASTGHRQRVERLLRSGIDINAVDVEARGVCRGTALQGAAASQVPQRAMLQFLLDEARADVNAIGGYYGTALQAATTSYADTTEVVEFLLQRGADVNISGGRYGSALQAALYFGNADIARKLIDAGADVDKVEENYQRRLQDVLDGKCTDVRLDDLQP